MRWKHPAAVFGVICLYGGERYAEVTWPNVPPNIWLAISIISGLAMVISLYHHEIGNWCSTYLLGREGDSERPVRESIRNSFWFGPVILVLGLSILVFVMPWIAFFVLSVEEVSLQILRYVTGG